MFMCHFTTVENSLLVFLSERGLAIRVGFYHVLEVFSRIIKHLSKFLLHITPYFFFPLVNRLYIKRIAGFGISARVRWIRS
jgi:hypothetical protein